MMKALAGGAGILLVLWQFTPLAGRLGHDFYHYFARIHLGAVHFWQNGLAVPHYTAALCGGLPFFADPQSMYYSVPQFLSFVMDPLLAVLVTHLVFYSLGYLGFYRLLRHLQAPSALSHLGSLLFVLNGFSFAHLLVGHLTHHSFLLFPWLLYFPLGAGTGSLRQSVAVFSLLVIYTVYSGGTHMIVVFLTGGLLLLPWLIQRKSDERQLKALGVFFAWSGVAVVAACAAKLAAGAYLSESFLHRPVDGSGLSPAMLVKQYFWFSPQSTPRTIRFGNWHFGPWEYVGFVSILLAPVVPLLLLRAFYRPKRSKVILAIVYVVLVQGIVWVGAAKHAGLNLPLLREYHNPLKIYGAFIPFLILGFVMLLKALGEIPRLRPTTPWVKETLYWVAVALACFEFKTSSDFFVSNPLVYGYQYDPAVHASLKARGALPPVQTITDSRGTDVHGVLAGNTSRACFEPMFGYRREVMKATVVAGPTSLVREGTYNLTHPGCLLYPNHFRCERWSRIPVSDKANFEKFIRGEVPDWGVPPVQQALLYLAVLTVLSLVGIAVWEAMRVNAVALTEAVA